MKSKLIISFLVTIVVILPEQNFAISKKPDVNQIYDKYVEKMGGLELWKNLHSYTRESYRKSGMKTNLYAKKPDQFALVFTRENRSVTKSYDGVYGWLDINGMYEPMRPGEAIEMAEEPEFYEDLLSARESGYDLFLEGEEFLGKLKCYKIRMIKSVSDTQWYWINKKTFILEMVGEFSEDPAHEGIFYTTRFEDYRNVDGYLVPFVEHLIRNGKDTSTITYTSMVVNPNISDAFFQYKPNSVRNTISWMKDRFSKEKIKSYTFSQKTIMYGQDSTRTQIWHEAVEYPGNFRIDFGEPSMGNSNIYSNDSVYVFRESAIKFKDHHIQSFLLMEGGYHYLTVDEALQKLMSGGLDTTAFCIDPSGKYAVLGTSNPETTCVQIWINMENGTLYKDISQGNNGEFYEGIVTKYRDYNGKLLPEEIEFRLENKLIQTEKYYDLRIDPKLPADFFRTDRLSDKHWYKN